MDSWVGSLPADSRTGVGKLTHKAEIPPKVPGRKWQAEQKTSSALNVVRGDRQVLSSGPGCHSPPLFLAGSAEHIANREQRVYNVFL